MAIYQFYLALIPRKGIIKLFDKIPEKIETDFENKEHLLSNDESDPFYDLIHEIWNNCDVNQDNVINQVDRIIKRADWGNGKYSNNWKIENLRIDNDAWIKLNENSGKIEEFTIRADLREKGLKYLGQILEIAIRFDLLFIDAKGNVLKPMRKELLNSIENSNAHRFVSNPDGFLSDLSNGKIQIE